MAVKITPPGLTVAEIEIDEEIGGRRSKDERRRYIEMSKMGRPTEVDIELLEKSFSKIPMDYRKFLLEFNGGAPDPSTIITSDNERVVNYFLQ